MRKGSEGVLPGVPRSSWCIQAGASSEEGRRTGREGGCCAICSRNGGLLLYGCSFLAGEDAISFVEDDGGEKEFDETSAPQLLQ
ncbi:MAG TPA: hypothetical protein VFQ30_00810 [Ktedonobacteraceae bacterium]|nr:hypothetical protein [Ktedonobacteraceae bacterium]